MWQSIAVALILLWISGRFLRALGRWSAKALRSTGIKADAGALARAWAAVIGSAFALGCLALAIPLAKIILWDTGAVGALLELPWAVIRLSVELAWALWRVAFGAD